MRHTQEDIYHQVCIDVLYEDQEGRTVYNSRLIGTEYEKKAAEYLTAEGYEILKMNYRVRAGEIDIVAKQGKYLVFVEVKYRRSGSSGVSLEAVTPAKQRVISRVAQFYLTVKYNCVDVPCRFDVVGIDGDRLQWKKNAFEYQTGMKI